jgi:hypothetical protein
MHNFPPKWPPPEHPCDSTVGRHGIERLSCPNDTGGYKSLVTTDIESGRIVTNEMSVELKLGTIRRKRH